MSQSRNSLQLGKFILKDYKAYRGTAKVDLSRDPEKTITVLLGGMGRGKTTILEAIYWCLYGQSRSAHSMDSDEGIINNNVLSELDINDRGETSVEIFLYDEDELRYKIKRIITYTKKNESVESVPHSSVGGNISAGIDLAETVEYSHLPKRSTNDWVVYTDPVQVRDSIENIFPSSLSSYFLFDAELLDNFFDTSDSEHVKNGIEKISGLPIIDDSITHLQKTSKEITKSARGVNVDPLKNEVFHLEKSIEDCERKTVDAKEKLAELYREINTIETFMRNHNEEMINNTQREVDGLNKDLIEIKAHLKKLNKDMADWLLYSNTAIRLSGSMIKSMEKCNEWEKEGKIPIAVSGVALKNILSGNPPVCICGTDLHEGSKERDHIKELLDKNLVESPVIQSISMGRGHWEEMATEVDPSQVGERLKQFRAERSRLNSIYDEKYRNMKELRKKLDEHDLEHIRVKSHRLNELRGDYNDVTGRKAVEDDKMKKYSRELDIKNQELNNVMAQDDKFKSQKNRRMLANTLAGILSQCRDDLIDELRTTVAKKTTEYFLKLVSKKSDFSKIEIESNYKTIALASNGKRKGLSAGQSCCLALSYIAAIRDIADKNYFMMIDSPLHNISQPERVDIAQNLPKFLPKTQITLLVQDQEYAGSIDEDDSVRGEEVQSVRKTLLDNNSVWKEYVLTSHKGAGDISHDTTIEEADIGQ